MLNKIKLLPDKGKLLLNKIKRLLVQQNTQNLILAGVSLLLLGGLVWWCWPSPAEHVVEVWPEALPAGAWTVDIYSPTVQLAAGTTVVWPNTSPEPVIVKEMTGQFSSGVLAPATRYHYTFGLSGTYTLTVQALDGQVLHQQRLEVLP